MRKQPESARSRKPKIVAENRSEGVENQDGLWDVHDLAKYLKIHEKEVYKLVERKEIPYIRLGKLRGIRFMPAQIDIWLEVEKSSAPEAVNCSSGGDLRMHNRRLGGSRGF